MKLRSVLGVAAIGLASLTLGAGPAQALDGTQLPFSYLTDIQVDDAHGRVFLSGDGYLVTTDLAGHLTTDATVSQVGQIAPSPDGSSLVVTRSSNGDDPRISVLDPATDTITKTISLPAGCAVGDIAPASGKVFFYSFCNGDDSWKIGAVDLGTSVVTLDLQAAVAGYSGKLFSVPGAPSMLVGWSANQVTVYDTTGGVTPTATVRTSRVLQPSDMVLTPDGSEVVVSRTSSDTLLAYSTTDLAQVGEYYSAGSSYLAVRSDGVLASGGYQDLSYFKPGIFEPDQVRQFPYFNALSAGSLAFGSKRLYEVMRVDPHLRLFVDTPGPPAALTISTGATTYPYGAAPLLTVKLTSPTTNRAVKIYATAYGATKKLVKTVTVPVSGQTTVVLPKVFVNTAYTAEFEGDEDFAAATATGAVKVVAKVTISTTFTSLSGYFHKVPTSPVHTLTVTALPASPLTGCLSVIYQRYVGGYWKGQATVSCVHRSSTGTWKDQLSYQHPGDRLRVMAKFSRSGANASTSTGWYYILFT